MVVLVVLVVLVDAPVCVIPRTFLIDKRASLLESPCSSRHPAADHPLRLTAKGVSNADESHHPHL